MNYETKTDFDPIGQNQQNPLGNPIPNPIDFENDRPKNDGDTVPKANPDDFDGADYEDTNNETDPIANPDNFDQNKNTENQDNLIPNPDDFDEGDSDDTSDDSERDATRIPQSS